MDRSGSLSSGNYKTLGRPVDRVVRLEGPSVTYHSDRNGNRGNLSTPFRLSSDLTVQSSIRKL